MPQELNVLRCYSCEMYQVHIAKKSKKWQCKICNEKQSLQMIYFRGNGVDCRFYVQSQNLPSKDETRENKDFPTICIEAYGLDCEADERYDEPCYCRQKKFIAEELSRQVTDDEDDYGENGNSSLSENEPKRRKFDCQKKQTRSLPTRKNLHSRNERSVRSETFPRMTEKRENTSKWDKFLPDGRSQGSFFERNQRGEEKFVAKRKRDDYFESGNGEESSDDENSNDCFSLRSNYYSVPEKSTDEREIKEIVASGDLKCSQVDDSSEGTNSAIGAIENNLFEDLEDDLNIELDF